MRHSLPAALVAILLSAQAAAQDDEGEEKAEGEGAPTGSLADGGDPVDEETSDEGRFAPKGKTGKLKEDKKKQEEEEEIAEIPRKQINVFADLLYVWGVPPDPDAHPVDVETADVTAFGLVVGGSYDLDPNFTVGLRIPWSRADFDVEARMFNIPLNGASSALGNPEVMGQYRIKRSPGVYLPIDFGIGIPFAQGNPDPTANDYPSAAKAMVNRTMDAGTGWHDGELYYVGRVPVKVGIGYVRQRVSWRFHAATKLVVAPKIRGELEQDGLLPQPNDVDVRSYEYNPVALRNVTAAGIWGNPWSGLWLGLDGWLAWDIIHEINRESDATPPDKLQLVLEPALGWDFDFMKLAASYIRPLGGRLDDISGVRVRAEFGF